MIERTSRSQSKPKEILSPCGTLKIDDSIEDIEYADEHHHTNKKRKITSYPKVESVLLELPYRGLYSFSEANTYDTNPDSKFETLFNKFVHKSKKSVPSSSTKNNLKFIHFDNYEIKTWYKSPYPKQFNSNSIMFICTHCLKYFDSKFTLNRHLLKCTFKYKPNGREIYRDTKEKISIFEIDGRKNVIFCQNLCLLAKLFLNSKTLYYDVEPFMFYIMYDYSDNLEFKFIGYFSKEKLNSTNYNLSCIMTIPIYQRRGFGKFLIDFSYLLSKREFKLGTPEKPLSHMGLLSYRSYWKFSIIREIYKLMKDNDGETFKVSIDDLSNLTGMIHDDIIIGLEQLSSFLSYKKDEDIKYCLIFNVNLVKSLYFKKSSSIKLNDDLLIWKPIILGPSGGINTNSTMVLNNENNLMNNISIIVNFLNDDLEDDRDIEDQTSEKIKLQNNGGVLEDVEDVLDKCSICHPYMKMVKKVQKRNNDTVLIKGKEIVKEQEELEDALINNGYIDDDLIVDDDIGSEEDKDDDYDGEEDEEEDDEEEEDEEGGDESDEPIV